MPPLLLLLLLALVADSYARPLPEAAHAVAAPATKWLLTWSDEFEGSDINARQAPYQHSSPTQP